MADRLVTISLFSKGGPAKCTNSENYRYCFHFYDGLFIDFPFKTALGMAACHTQ